MKKNLKLLSIIAMSVILLNVRNVSAEAYEGVSIDFEETNVKYNDLRTWDHSYLTNKEFGQLRLYTYWIYTSKTSPCPNCKFSIRPYNVDGDFGEALAFQLDDDKKWPTMSVGSPGTYYLKGTRTDWTIDKLGATIKAWFNIA